MYKLRICYKYLILYYQFYKDYLNNIRQSETMEVDRKSFHKLALGLMTIGYIWLWFFNRNPHVLIKFLTMQSYFLVWLYFLMQTLNKNDISGYSMDRLFENNFVFQVFMVTPAYWVLIHGPMVDSKRFPLYQVLWNAYVHIVPVILIVTEFFWSKKQFQKDNWKDTACFYFLFAWPINLIYSHLNRPVYKFILYDDADDYITMFFLGLVAVFVHWGCYEVYKRWNKSTQPASLRKVT